MVLSIKKAKFNHFLLTLRRFEVQVMPKTSLSSRQENLAYVLVWLLLLAAPLLSEWLMSHSDSDVLFEWSRILRAWIGLAPFLLVFVLHNWLLAPLLVYGRRRSYYVLGVAVVVALFTFYQCTTRPPHLSRKFSSPSVERRMEHRMERRMEHRMEHPGQSRPGELRPHRDHRPPAFMGEHDIVAVIVLILMLGMNLGIKFYFRQRSNEQKMKDLERQNLEHQLAYLRYQVNPHFLMNTLNNIHALIDIDSEGAQEAVVELSRLLRYALYDAERPTVSLQKEVDFVGNYIALMRIRLGEQVEVRFDVPRPVPSGSVPPLLFASFVENAFKHGVSYQQTSFVHIAIEASQGRLVFSCTNSRFPDKSHADADAGGLGLRNVRQRLDLLFPGNYQLDFREAADTYAVHLDIPLGA